MSNLASIYTKIKNPWVPSGKDNSKYALFAIHLNQITFKVTLAIIFKIITKFISVFLHTFLFHVKLYT